MEKVTLEEIKKFLAIDYGYGSGNGNGDGYGNGCGHGYGYGTGYVYNYGNGSGSGYGNGFGSGYGDGYGDGDGRGYGYGYGSDSGNGLGNGNGYGDIKTFNNHIVCKVDDIPTIFYSIHANYAKCAIICSDFTLKDCYVARVDNCFAHGNTLADAVRDATEKALEEMPEDKRIEQFKVEFPTLQDKAKGSIFFSWHHILTGSCEFGRNEFVKIHGLDMDKEYTVEYFLEITKNSYGGCIIQKLRQSYDTEN